MLDLDEAHSWGPLHLVSPIWGSVYEALVPYASFCMNRKQCNIGPLNHQVVPSFCEIHNFHNGYSHSEAQKYSHRFGWPLIQSQTTGMFGTTVNLEKLVSPCSKGLWIKFEGTHEVSSPFSFPFRLTQTEPASSKFLRSEGAKAKGERTSSIVIGLVCDCHPSTLLWGTSLIISESWNVSDYGCWGSHLAK